MDSAVDEIKRKIDLTEYIGARVQLKKAGRNFKANCPFHNEKTPSFVVSPERQIWRCFGSCQTGGDVIAFLMKWDNLTFYEAVKELAQEAGIKLDSSKFEDRQWKEKEVLLHINQLAAKYFHFILTDHKTGKAGLDYVSDRGLNTGLIKTFQLGYAPNSWDSLLKFLRKKGFTEKQIVTAGLALQSQKNTSRYYDRFRGRLMFPIIDARQNILGFSGRLIHDQEKQAKYVNTPETPLYRKRETLYGMHVAHEAIRKDKTAIIVEGEFDMISSFAHDIKNVVAIKGSAFTKDQLMLLKRYTKHIVLALDADFSGTQTTLRAIKDAEDMDFRVDIIHFDFGKDPDEALAKDSVAYKKLLKKPIPIYDFIIETALEQHDERDAYEKKEIVDDVLPFIQGISNPIVKSHYVKMLSELIGTETRDIESSMRKLSYKQKQKRTAVPKRQEKKHDRYETLQKYILSSLLQHEKPLKLFEQIKGIIASNDFSIPSYREIFTAFAAYKSRTFELDMFTKNFSDPIQGVLDELFLVDVATELNTKDTEKSLSKSLYELKRLSLKDKLKKAITEEKDSSTIQDITRDLAQVEKELSIR